MGTGGWQSHVCVQIGKRCAHLIETSAEQDNNRVGENERKQVKVFDLQNKQFLLFLMDTQKKKDTK